ncbi:MAG TPA: DUF2188 domain-containing protein [Steroidobacteraceae bacterium]|jgi:hypothetical protein|nr:DUF2188 domain-containing protein [Steroidobacteraceae bacterium]
MQMTYVRVQPREGIWGVTLNGDEAPLATFARWDDAVDYARGLAIENGDCVLEGEDRNGRLSVREEFYSDATGAVCVYSVLDLAH